MNAGSRTGEPAVTVSYQRAEEKGSQLTAYPNPVQDVLTLEHVAKEDRRAQLRVVDAYGRTVFVQGWDQQQGMNRTQLLTEQLGNGTYLVYLEGEAAGQRFVVLK